MNNDIETAEIQEQSLVFIDNLQKRLVAAKEENNAEQVKFLQWFLDDQIRIYRDMFQVAR